MPSKPHHRAIDMPETSNGSLSCPVGLGAMLKTTHLQNRTILFRAMDRSLDKIPDRAILHRDIASGPDEIGLGQSEGGHIGIVLLETDIRPLQLGLIRSLGRNQA